MPNLKYSGSKGVVQSTGLGQFHVSGVGIAHDLDEVTLNNGDGNATSHGITIVTQTAGVNTLTIKNPVTVEGAAGQQKLVRIKTAGAGSVQLASDGTANILGDLLTAAGDYALLVWTGTDWVSVAQLCS